MAGGLTPLVYYPHSHVYETFNSANGAMSGTLRDVHLLLSAERIQLSLDIAMRHSNVHLALP